MREIELRESACASAAELHAFLKEALNFPSYYGANLSALNDCLGDICEPTRITVLRDNSVEEPWFDKACVVLGRAALENDNLDVTFLGR